jgi:hypothetical protein
VILATADETAQTQSLVAIDRATGARQWQTVLHTGHFPASGQMHPKSSHANGTVACDGERLYISFLNNNHIWLDCVSLDGEIVWQRELGEFAARFGYAPSPCLHGSLVFVAGDHEGGGFLAGVHRESGETVWLKSRPAAATYSSPVVTDAGGIDRLLLTGAGMVAAYDPTTGRELWTCPGITEATCGTCVWDAERIYASGGYPDRQTIAVSAAGAEVWHNDVKCYEQSMLVHDGFLYAADDNGIVWCWDAATGAEQWKSRWRGPVSASLVLAANHLYATNESGLTLVFDASPAAFRQVAENQLGDDAFSTPTICGGRIYHRVGKRGSAGRQEWLYCLGPEAATAGSR